MGEVVAGPPPEVLAWVTGTLRSGIDAWAALPQADEAGPWRLDLADGRRAVLGLGEPGHTGLATETAALDVCDAHGVLAPRVLAVDETGAEVGRPTLVQSWVDGSSAVPARVTRGRARALGAAAAAIHAVALTPTALLPDRASSLEGLPWGTLPVPEACADLFAAVREAVAATPALDGPVGFVHGDLWQGNTLWADGVHRATLDWDHAGVGSPTIDLGTLRWDLSVLGGSGADDVVRGWSDVTGLTPAPEVVALGDLVAVLASPPDLALWLGNFRAQGRPDLTLDLVTDRRDAFARAALAVLT